MAIEKRTSKDGKPAYRVRISSIDPVTGKRRNITIGTFHTKREAQRAEREALTQQDRGALADPSRSTVRDLLDAWLGSKRGSVSDNTLRQYQYAIDLYLVPALGSLRLQRLTPATIQHVYDRWRDDGVSPRYIQRNHLVLSQALDHGVRLRMIPVNVARETTRPTVRRKDLVVWNPDQLRRFLAVASTDRYAPLWYLLGLEAMRRGEALGLRWRDINWERGTAHIAQTVLLDQTNRGTARIQPGAKTAAGSRTVRLTSQTLRVLREHRDRQRFERQVAGDAWQDHDLIVTTSLGTPLNPSNVTRSFERLRKAADLPKLTVHGLRHTCATLMLASGSVSPKEISDRLGHSTVQITLDTYSHLLPDMQERAAEAMSRIVSLDPTGTDSSEVGP